MINTNYQVNNPELKLSKKIIEFLKNRGFHSIDDLSRMTEARFNRDFAHKGKIRIITQHDMDLIKDAMKMMNVKWRPEKAFDREKMIKEIKDVLHYKDGDYYVGSLASYHVSALLDSRGVKNITEADDKTILKVHDYLESYIDHMKDYPIVRCPTCGSRVKSEVLSNSDSFTIRFHANYVGALIKSVGIKKAKSRLLDEGRIALKNEINRRFEGEE